MLVILSFVWHRIEDLHTVTWLAEKLPFGSFRLSRSDYLQITMFVCGLLWLTASLRWPKKRSAIIGEADLPIRPFPPVVPATTADPNSEKRVFVDVTPNI